MSSTSEYNGLFLTLALDKEILTEGQVDACRRALGQTRDWPKPQTAMAVAVDKGFITNEQAAEVSSEIDVPPAQRPIVGGFEIMAKVGEGGMGRVFKALQLNLDRTVALKILPSNLAKDETYLERFYREARAAAKLRHPNIVSAIDVGCSDGHHYFAMEFVRGKSLSRILRERGRLPQPEAVEIVRQVALGLAHAHQSGIVHRDIKPSNIMVSRDGQAKLCDLGLARRDDVDESGLLEPGKTVGSPKYMAPEQARAGGEVDARSDLYSLGVTFFRALAGCLPFDGDNAREFMRKHVAEPAPDVRVFEPEVSPAVAAVVARLLHKDPVQRYQNAAELTVAIEEAAAAAHVAVTVRDSGEGLFHGPQGARTGVLGRSGIGRGTAIAVVALLVAGTCAIVAIAWALFAAAGR